MGEQKLLFVISPDHPYREGLSRLAQHLGCDRYEAVPPNQDLVRTQVDTMSGGDIIYIDPRLKLNKPVELVSYLAPPINPEDNSVRVLRNVEPEHATRSEQIRGIFGNVSSVNFDLAIEYIQNLQQILWNYLSSAQSYEELYSLIRQAYPGDVSADIEHIKRYTTPKTPLSETIGQRVSNLPYTIRAIIAEQYPLPPKEVSTFDVMRAIRNFPAFKETLPPKPMFDFEEYEDISRDVLRYDLEARLGLIDIDFYFREAYHSIINHMTYLFRDQSSDVLQEWLKQIPVSVRSSSPNPMLALVDSCVNIIVAGLKPLGITNKLTYNHLVYAVMQNPVFDLVPYLKIDQFAATEDRS